MDRKIKDFSCNINPLGPPKNILKILSSNLESVISSYPDYKNRKPIEALTEFYNLPEENLTISNGSTELFFIIPGALDIGLGIVILPTFWEYDFTLKHSNKKIKYFKTISKEEFQVDISKLEKEISLIEKNNNAAVYICNPNNPTSTLINSKSILDLVIKFPKIKFIVDETYLLFDKNYNDFNLMGKVQQYTNLIVITSLSKFFSVPGVRLGIVAANKDYIDAIKKEQVPYGINTIAQYLIPHLFQDKEFINLSRKFMADEKERVYKFLKKDSNLYPYYPSANFILSKLKNPNLDSITLCNHLEKNGITIKGGEEFKGLGNKYIRFSIKTKEENNLLFNKLNEFYNLFK